MAGKRARISGKALSYFRECVRKLRHEDYLLPSVPEFSRLTGISRSMIYTCISVMKEDGTWDCEFKLASKINNLPSEGLDNRIKAARQFREKNPAGMISEEIFQ